MPRPVPRDLSHLRGQWAHAVVLLVPEASVAAANQAAADWDPDAGGDRTFTDAPRCSATGAEPATHRITRTRATTAMRDAIESAAVVGLEVFREQTIRQVLRAKSLKIVVEPG